MSKKDKMMLKDWIDNKPTKLTKERKPEKFVGLTINGQIMGEIDLNNDTEIHITLTNPKTKQVIKRLMILDNIPKAKMSKGINLMFTDNKGKILDKGWQIQGHGNWFPNYFDTKTETEQ